MGSKRTEFIRTPEGVKVVGNRFSIHLSFEEITRLNGFVYSGSRVSSTNIEKNIDRSALRRVHIHELENELDRRAVLRDARLETEAAATVDGTEGDAE